MAVQAQIPTSRDEMIERYLPLAHSVARRYRHSPEPMEDLYQVAAMGLVKAVDRWDPSLGHAFSSFAVPTIAGELKRHFRDRTWMVRPSRDVQERWVGVERMRDQLWGRLGRSPTAAEIAAELGCGIDDVLEALMAGDARSTRSLDEPVRADGDDALALGEVVGADDAELPRVELSVTIDEIAGILTEREREVLRLRFVEDMTQAEIGERVGCSQMHVSRIVRSALERLRTYAEADVLRTDR